MHAVCRCRDGTRRALSWSWVEQSQSECGPGDCREFLGDTETREDTEDLVVEMHRTRLRIHRRPAIEHETVDAVLREQGGGGDAGRACADDDDGNVRASRVPHSGALGTKVDRAVIGRDTEFDDVAMLKYFGFLACRLKNAFHFTAGGSSEPMISIGFGGRTQRGPTGVPVNMRSPAVRSWNRVSDCSACSGR